MGRKIGIGETEVPGKVFPALSWGLELHPYFSCMGRTNCSSGSVSRLDPNELTYSVCGLGQHTKNFLPRFLKLEQRVCRASLLHCSLGKSLTKDGPLRPRQSSLGAMNLVASKALKAVHSVLGQAALDFVVEEDLKAHLTCWYIQKYVKENPLPQYLERLQP